MMQESIDAIPEALDRRTLRNGIYGRFWSISPQNATCIPSSRVGCIPRAPAALSAHRALLAHTELRERTTAGERRWIPISGQFFHRRYLRGHWETYAGGARRLAGGPIPTSGASREACSSRRPTREAEDYLADPRGGLTYYYRWFLFSFGTLRKALFMVKAQLEMPDEDVTVDAIKRTLIIAGGPRRVLDQLVALRDETGHFGTTADGRSRLGPPCALASLDGAPGDRGDAEVRAPRGGDPTGLSRFPRRTRRRASPRRRGRGFAGLRVR